MTVQEQHTLKALENFCSKANKCLSEIDWEQRRYEIAKDVFITLLGIPYYSEKLYDEPYPEDRVDMLSVDAVEYAEILIEKLKKQSNGI